MALATNTLLQIQKKLQAILVARFPGYVVSPSVDANGNPALILNDGSADRAAMAIVQRSYNGFNVVAELSASAAVGLPETVIMLAIRSDATQVLTADIAMSVKEMGTSSMTFAFPAAATVAAAIDPAQQVQEWVNDAFLGASGT
jgi:hypothetical protein